MSKRKRSYSSDFKLQAAKLVTGSGYSYAEAGSRLGVPSSSIVGWVKKYKKSGYLPESSEGSPANELKTLRKELKQVKLENEILKKATAYFARDTL